MSAGSAGGGAFSDLKYVCIVRLWNKTASIVLFVVSLITFPASGLKMEMLGYSTPTAACSRAHL